MECIFENLKVLIINYPFDAHLVVRAMCCQVLQMHEYNIYNSKLTILKKLIWVHSLWSADVSGMDGL